MTGLQAEIDSLKSAREAEERSFIDVTDKLNKANQLLKEEQSEKEKEQILRTNLEKELGAVTRQLQELEQLEAGAKTELRNRLQHQAKLIEDLQAQQRTSEQGLIEVTELRQSALQRQAEGEQARQELDSFKSRFNRLQVKVSLNNRMRTRNSGRGLMWQQQNWPHSRSPLA